MVLMLAVMLWELQWGVSYCLGLEGSDNTVILMGSALLAVYCEGSNQWWEGIKVMLLLAVWERRGVVMCCEEVQRLVHCFV